jgi:hypothetical protein
MRRSWSFCSIPGQNPVSRKAYQRGFCIPGSASRPQNDVPKDGCARQAECRTNKGLWPSTLPLARHLGESCVGRVRRGLLRRNPTGAATCVIVGLRAKAANTIYVMVVASAEPCVADQECHWSSTLPPEPVIPTNAGIQQRRIKQRD